MKTLFIDTHLSDIIVFLYEDGKVVNKKEIINKKNNSEFMFPTIVEVIHNQKLDEIIVVNGPGSFTGVRLGVTIAKTLAYTLNISIKTITSLEVAALGSKCMNIALSDGNGYYIAEYDENLNPKKEYIYLNNEDYHNLNNGILYNETYIIDPESIYNYMKNKKETNAHGVNPIYIKKIGVELDKKSNN